MSFAEALQNIRKEKGITQEQLAERMEVSRQSVSKWEKGDTYPETERLIQLTGLLECSLDALLNEEIQKSKIIFHGDTEEKDIEDIFKEKCPNPFPKKRKGRVRWTDENIRRALDFLEGDCRVHIGTTSSNIKYEKHFLVHKGNIFYKTYYADGREDPIKACDRDEIIDRLKIDRLMRKFESVDFEYS